jgi:hypothetical protein
LSDRKISRHGNVAAVEAAGGQLRDEALLGSGRVRDDADRAADGVAAEQRALRTLQDLDAVDVQQALVRADGARQVHAVDVHADAGIEIEREVVLADAADRRGQAPRCRRRTGSRYRG